MKSSKQINPFIYAFFHQSMKTCKFVSDWNINAICYTVVLFKSINLQIHEIE